MTRSTIIPSYLMFKLCRNKAQPKMNQLNRKWNLMGRRWYRPSMKALAHVPNISHNRLIIGTISIYIRFMGAHICPDTIFPRLLPEFTQIQLETAANELCSTFLHQVSYSRNLLKSTWSLQRMKFLLRSGLNWLWKYRYVPGPYSFVSMYDFLRMHGWVHRGSFIFHIHGKVAFRTIGLVASKL